MMKLGLNIDIDNDVNVVLRAISEYLLLSDEAIELSLTKLEGILEFPFEKLYPLLRQFKYKSIHLPVVSIDQQQKKTFLKYPDSSLTPYLNVIRRIAENLDISTYVIHPDQVIDFNWANNKFGELLGFENMDNRKSFGTTIDDMEKVFERCPQAKWIFDVNHLYTNDTTMHSASVFFNKFRNRLTHYHVSAFGGFHSSFTKNPNEKIILKAVLDPSVPMIHEGYNYTDNNLKQEYNMIEKILSENAEQSNDI